MNTARLEKLRAELEAACAEVLDSKGKDYAGEGEEKDRLGNFRAVADLLKMFDVDTATPLGTWAVYFLKHVFAILAYIGQRTESEPIKMRFVDARNYLDLGFALAMEEPFVVPDGDVYIDPITGAEARRPPKPIDPKLLQAAATARRAMVASDIGYAVRRRE